LIVKSNDNNDYVSSHHGSENSVVPVGDYAYEQRLRESIKSILCPRVVTEKGASGFNNILKSKIEGNEDDCVYMHLLVPGEESEQIDSVKPGRGQNVFYEIGCKVYEINKIYK